MILIAVSFSGCAVAAWNRELPLPTAEAEKPLKELAQSYWGFGQNQLALSFRWPSGDASVPHLAKTVPSPGCKGLTVWGS